MAAEPLGEIMEAAGFEDYGVADYADTLPGTGFRQGDLFPGIRSVVVCLIPWDTGKNEGRNMARHCVGMDYHLVGQKHLAVAAEILRRVYPEDRFAFFVDSSPVAEVRAAVLAGLGVRGLNNLLINEKYGTRCAVGEIVTTHKFQKSAKQPGTCLLCNKCVEACPNAALSPEGFDKTRCVSAISQKKGELTERERGLVRKVGFISGCDRCTDVCPMNRHADGIGWPEFKDTAKPVYAPGMDLSDRSYGWKGPEILERNYKILEG
ncbi:MAG TPA: DUF1730 domain-containing protein [Oscillospiraceae bacterium]|nr:epoxyqueuosine reductase [Oscillospiraceae bacterium]HNW03886.1 DUF1730 domain-containing protein [Oscillospiraceae bacterium]HPV99565.1 DUF1730 domain-containing protein [Oscillospiraceae bacterium]